MVKQDGLTGSAWGDWANYTASPNLIALSRPWRTIARHNSMSKDQGYLHRHLHRHFLCRSWSLDLGTSDISANPLKSGCSGATILSMENIRQTLLSWKYTYVYPTHWSTLTYFNHPKWPKGQGFFHQRYAAICGIHVYLFHVFSLVLDLQRVCESLCEFCVQCRKLSGGKVLFLH